ncbi:MAG: preprotein translocase subunit YajC [Bacteroidaceae bacterium]|nr:preprotein translocase subunit YajC [Bacteroidaceae bacterium]
MTTMFILMQTGAAGGMSMLLMMIIIFAIMWLFMIRPQQKRQKEIQNFRNAITVGTNVVTAGGIYGVVKSIDEADNALMVEIANGVRIKVDRNSVYASPNQQIEQK